MDVQENIRRIVQAQIIECLNRFYAMETGMWGTPLDALIVRTVVTGKIQDRLYDLSSLSATLDIPISTVHRKVSELEQVGLLKRERKGRSSYLTATEKTCIHLDKSFDEMIATLENLYRGTHVVTQS